MPKILTSKELSELFKKFNEGTLSQAEKNRLDAWYAQEIVNSEAQLPDEESAELSARLRARLPLVHPARERRLWPRIAAAASILIALSAAAYLYFKEPEAQQVAQTDPEQVAPLQQGVTLSLNGKTIQLAKSHKGHIAENIDQADSSLQYKATGAAPAMNTLTNNGNSKFSVQLADGSAVTLDIGSSLSYPSSFTSATHQVSLTGQAYFKVKHIPGQRFLVKARGQVTEDIGTEFNINAYDDEPVIRTTLLEGSIKVNARTLKPGEQAVVEGGQLKVEKADIEEVTAWLQDKIVLEQQTLETILRKVARIYGVQVVYLDQDVKAYTYGGAVNTSTKLSSVLNFLRKAGGVDFKVEGKVVKVFKKKKQN